MSEIRGMEESDWPVVSALIAEEWEAGHPVLDKDFFFWQHGGFGDLAGVRSSALAFDSHRIVGMRGVIPGIYQVPTGDGRYDYLPGGSFAMWLVKSESRGTGIGKALLRHCEERFPVMVALGSNESTSVPIYMKNGFFRQDALHHWFVPLDSIGMKLIYGSGSKPEVWRPSAGISGVAIEETDSPELAAEIWTRFSSHHMVFALRRTVDFWKWRYFGHPTFRYRLYVDANHGSLAVTRTEDVVVHGEEIKVLRIIELVSSVGDLGSEAGIRTVAEFLNALLSDAFEQGISAADYRCSSTLMSPAFTLAGFAFRELERLPKDAAGFAGQLNPLVMAPRPINLHWKVKGRSTGTFPHSYFVKSDNDMDRPNHRGRPSAKLTNRGVEPG